MPSVRDRRPADEREPLLADRHEDSNDYVKVTGDVPPVQQHRGFFPKFDNINPAKYGWVPLLGCLILFTNEAEWSIKNVAVMRAIEAMYCVEYYKDRDPALAALGKKIPEKLCKASSIEVNVANINAWGFMIRMISCIIGALWLGALADRKGRKIVLLLHKITVVLSVAWQLATYLLYPRVPPEMMLVYGCFGIAGGNFDLGTAMLFAAYTDVLPVASQRTTLFFLTTAVQYIAQCFGPLLGGLLMNLDGKGTTPEIAIFAGSMSAVISLLIVLFLWPETTQKKSSPSSSATDTDDPVKSNVTGNGHLFKSFTRPNLLQKAKNFFRKPPADLTLAITLKNTAHLNSFDLLLLGLGIFSVMVGARQIEIFALVQYPVIKLGWTFAQAAIVPTVQALFVIFNYLLFLPAYNRLGTHLGLPPSRTPLLIMFFSVIILAAGSVLLGFSATVTTYFSAMLVWTLGIGYPVAAQGYLSTRVPKAKLARVLATMSLAGPAGKTVASAMFARVLKAGLDSGREVLKGLPFFASAGFFGVGIALTAGLLVRDAAKPNMEGDGEVGARTEEDDV